MKSIIYKLTATAILSTTLIGISVLPTLAEVSSDTTNLTISGVVSDLATTSPLKDVYIKQQNTLNTVLSDEAGNFSITLEKNSSKKLSISKEGYLTQEITITGNQNVFRVSLSPIVKLNNQNLPAPHSDAADLFNYSARPISSVFSALYQVRYQSLKVPTLQGDSSVSSSGWAINEIAANGQVRFNDWLASAKVFRSRYPVNIQSFQFTPAYYLDTTQFQLGGGRVFKASEKMDLYAGLSYLVHFNTPDNRGGSDNKPIAYTNSYQDYPQTKQGPGLTGMLGYLINDRIVFNASATIYPYLFTSYDSLTQNNTGYRGMAELGGGLRFETLPGIYVTANYVNQLFFGGSNFLDDSNFFNVGLSLDPFKMANISQSSNSNVTDGVKTGN